MTGANRSIGKGIALLFAKEGAELDATEKARISLKQWIYRNNLKNREFGQKAPQIFDSERVTIAEGQGTSENQKGGVRPTQPKTDSSGCFAIKSGLSN